MELSTSSRPPQPKKKKSPSFVNISNSGQTKTFTVFSLNLEDSTEQEKEQIQDIYMVVTQCKQLEPDIITLQHVTRKQRDKCRDLLSSLYYSFDLFENEEKEDNETSTSRTTRELLFFRRTTVSILEPYYHDYDERITKERRQLLCCTITIPHLFGETPIHIMTTELDEIQDSEHLRMQQMEMIKVVCQKKKNVILCCSLHAYDEDHEPVLQSIQMSSFQDAWIQTGCSIPLKMTYSMPTIDHPKKTMQRPDRILYKCDTKRPLFQLRNMNKRKLRNQGHRMLFITFQQPSSDT